MHNGDLHPKFQLVLSGRSFSAPSFLNESFEEGWLVEIQSVVRFWITKQDSLSITTSGSTGKPKTIDLGREMIRASARASISYFGMKDGQKALLFIPARYIGGKMLLIRAMVAGMQLHLLKPKTQLPQLARQFDFVSLTPHQATNSIKQLDHFQTVLLGGAPVNVALESALQAVQARIYQSYGMTETASHVAVRHLNGPAESDWFEALPGMSFSQNSAGCLQIHAPKLGLQDLITTDMVELKDEQHFRWRGRKDYVINSGGIKIQPEELEKSLEKVIDVPFFIAGLPDGNLGEKVVLFIESPTRFTVDFSNLPRLQKPKQIIFLPKFVLTATQKINRKATIQLAQNF